MRCCIGQSRRCVGHPGDTSVAPTLRGARPRHCGGPPGRARGPMRDDARRGVTCDARCRNGTRCPRRFVRGECGVASANRGIASAIRATQVSPLRCGVLVHGVAAGHPGGRMGCLRRCSVCGGRVVSRLVETVSRTGFPVAVTVFPVSRPAPLVTASVNVRGLMDFGGGEETFCSTKLD